MDDSESQKEKEQDKEPAPTAELSDISIVIDQGTQQLGRTDLWDAVASDSASDSASPSLFENPPVQVEPLGLPDIASLQHKKFTEDRYSLLKERATLLDDIISVLFLLENILAIRTQPLAGASLQKGYRRKQIPPDRYSTTLEAMRMTCSTPYSLCVLQEICHNC